MWHDYYGDKVSLGGNQDFQTTFEAADNTVCNDSSQLSPDLDKLMVRIT